jgi:hypothetical protein
MEELRKLAVVAVGRAVFFAWLGIATLVFAFSFDPALALKIGGTSGLILCLVLIERSGRAEQMEASATEMWSMLAPARRPSQESQKRLLTAVLAETYLRCARSAAGASVAFFAGAILTGLLIG